MSDQERGRALEQGRAAYGRRAWEEAYQALSQVDAATPLPAADLERLAWSAALTERDDALLEALERLYHAAAEADDCAEAARFSFWLGFRLLSLGETARAGGWLQRSQRLVDRDDVTAPPEGTSFSPSCTARWRAEITARPSTPLRRPPPSASSSATPTW